MEDLGVQERVLLEAEFDPKVRTYWLLSGILILAVTVVGIPLIPVWYFIGLSITERYLRRMSCTLGEKTLRVSKGILTRVEKTVPLEKITDMGLVQGPIMRYLGLHALSVETAGQSSSGALLKLLGVVETRQFRDAVLRQRDHIVASGAADARPSSPVPDMGEHSADELLADIRDTLHRIEGRMNRIDDAGERN